METNHIKTKRVPQKVEDKEINIPKVPRQKVRDRREATRAIAECIMGKGVIDDRAFSILCAFAVEWKKREETQEEIPNQEYNQGLVVPEPHNDPILSSSSSSQ